MGKTHFLLVFAASVLLAAGCKDAGKRTGNPEYKVPETVTVADTTIYGRCGEGTAMHTLELITDKGDTVVYSLGTGDDEADVQGGLLVGDRLAVIAAKNADGENVAARVLNLTTLMGTWTSIDRHFELHEDGSVKSDVKEPRPYTEWSILNGRLVLSSDTFHVYSLGPDSLYLENDKGIYVYKRIVK